MDSSPSCHKGAQEKEQGHLIQGIEDVCIVAFFWLATLLTTHKWTPSTRVASIESCAIEDVRYTGTAYKDFR